jgi:hypothetical protein
MLIHRGPSFERLGLPGRRSWLQRAARHQLSSGIGRRWSRGRRFPSVHVPELLDQPMPRERVCEICQVVMKIGPEANRVEGQNDPPRWARSRIRSRKFAVLWRKHHQNEKPQCDKTTTQGGLVDKEARRARAIGAERIKIRFRNPDCLRSESWGDLPGSVGRRILCALAR